MILDISYLNDITLLLLRLVVALIFIESGRRDLQDPTRRSASIGMSKGFTIFLGLAEVAGGLGLISGVLLPSAALGLILIMIGAIYKKAIVWKTGFWGTAGVGWHYEIMIVVMNLVIITTGGGRFIL